jgi:hypothetical protein
VSNSSTSASMRSWVEQQRTKRTRRAAGGVNPPHQEAGHLCDQDEGAGETL